MLESLSMAPLVKDRKFIMLFFAFKMFGVETFQKLSNLGNILAQTRRGINYHFTTLTKDLEASGGPYICGQVMMMMMMMMMMMNVHMWAGVHSG